jgi:hypothetical protein
MNNAEVILKCLNGIDDLKARQKALVKEHVERIKRLQSLLSDVQHAARSGQRDLLDGQSLSVSPEIQSLLENPVGGL